MSPIRGKSTRAFASRGASPSSGPRASARARAAARFAPSAAAPGEEDRVAVEVGAEAQRVLGCVAPAADLVAHRLAELRALLAHHQLVRPTLSPNRRVAAVETC